MTHGKKRIVHWMQPTQYKDIAPQAVLSVDTETHSDAEAWELVLPQALTLGCSIFSVRSAGEWMHSESLFQTQDDFWNLVDNCLQLTDELWIIGHNLAGFDIQVLAWEEQLRRRGWTCLDVPLPKPFIARFERMGKKLVLSDLTNYYGFQSLKKIGSKMELPKGEPGGCGDCEACKKGKSVTCSVYRPDAGCVPGTSAWEELETYCLRDTQIVALAFTQLIDFCYEHGIPWALTLPSMAMATYKSKWLRTQSISIHNDPWVLGLEKEAYHGALTDAWRIGVAGQWPEFRDVLLREGELATTSVLPGIRPLLYKLDVNSMYPSVMHGLTYPCGLEGCIKREALELLDGEPTTPGQRVQWLKEMLAGALAYVARVRINTHLSPSADVREMAICARKVDGKLKYAVGKFEVVLTTRELQRALELGIVEDLVEYAAYRQDYLFREYVEFFMELKTKYKKEGNGAWEAVTKLFLNGFYGKWGQQNELYEDLKAAPLADNVFVEDCEIVFPDEHVEQWTCRQFMGKAYISKGQKEAAFDAFIAIAAHITADARLVLMRYRQIAGFGNCYYGDTDSLVCNEEGKANLEAAGVVDKFRLGALDIEDEAYPEDVEVVTLKDYKFGDYVKMKGRRPDAEKVSENRWKQTQFRKLNGALRDGDVNQAVINIITKRFSRTYDKGVIMGDGWVMPVEVDE